MAEADEVTTYFVPADSNTPSTYQTQNKDQLEAIKAQTELIGALIEMLAGAKMPASTRKAMENAGLSTSNKKGFFENVTNSLDNINKKFDAIKKFLSEKKKWIVGIGLGLVAVGVIWYIIYLI